MTKHSETTSETVGAGLTTEEFMSWLPEEREHLRAAVDEALAAGRTMNDMVQFNHKHYLIGYVKPFVDDAAPHAA
jgi:hypothetical protein